MPENLLYIKPTPFLFLMQYNSPVWGFMCTVSRGTAVY